MPPLMTSFPASVHSHPPPQRQYILHIPSHEPTDAHDTTKALEEEQIVLLNSAMILSSSFCVMDPKLPHYSLATCFVALLLLFLPSPSSAQLSFDFYSLSCPDVEQLVRNAVQSAAGLDGTVPGKLLRLMFHDCMVEGCDASVLIQGNDTERSDPGNKSLGGFEVVDSAKRALELWCPGTVSCADILVLAARDAVEMTGGPSVQVPLGRRDGRLSTASNVRPNILDTGFSVDEMVNHFSAKGLSADDLVTLTGAHTIGLSHCNAFSERFKQDSSGNLVPADSSIDQDYAMQLSRKCPAGASASVTVDNDPVTPSSFDNQYFSNLLADKGLMQTDAVLASDPRTKDKVQAFAEDQDGFFTSWAESFVKLSAVGAKTGDEGEIRTSCMSVNS